MDELIIGQQRRHRHGEQTYGHGGWGWGKKERVGCMERVTQ